MRVDAIEDELLSPAGLSCQLVKQGLKKTVLSQREVELVFDFIKRYKRLSRYDCIALSIAVNRKILLATSDNALRRAAETEQVEIIGTLGVIDTLFEGKHICIEQYKQCLILLQNINGGKVRLPENEIEWRLDNIKNNIEPIENAFTSPQIPSAKYLKSFQLLFFTHQEIAVSPKRREE